MEELELTPALLGLGEISEEVGAVIRRFPQPQQKQVVNTVNRAVNAAVVNKITTPNQNFLQVKATEMSAETQRKWAEGKVKLEPTALYIRKDISLGAGRIQLLDDTVDRVEGISNISKQKLPNGVNAAISRIELNFARGTGVTTKTAALAPLTSSSDPALRNGEIEISVGSVIKLKIPVILFDSPRKLGSPANGYDLPSRIFIKEDEQIQATLVLVGTMTSSTDKDIIEVLMLGDQTSTK